MFMGPNVVLQVPLVVRSAATILYTSNVYG
jgi:hypothetical protein